MNFSRALDFIVMLIVSDVVDYVFRMIALSLGAQQESVILNLLTVLTLWVKLGLILLYYRQVPFRSQKDNKLAATKTFILAVFWPMVVGHPSLSWNSKTKK